MSDILGYDVNGEPLRAGDKVTPVMHTKENAGRIFTCRGNPEFPLPMADIEFEEVAPNKRQFQGVSKWLRKLKDDSQSKERYTDQHKPCGLSFDELMKKHKGVTA